MFDLESKCDRQCEEFFRSVTTEGANTPSNTDELLSPQDIPWAKKELVQASSKFYLNHAASIFFANLSALVFGFSVKSDIAVLLRTGKFNTGEYALTRILSTGSRTLSWFQGDLLDPASEGFKTSQRVRQMHSAASKIMNKPLPDNEEQFQWTKEKEQFAQAIRDDLDFVKTNEAPTDLFTYDPPVPLNQFDMMMTQFGFIFTVYRAPEAVGLQQNHPDIEAFLHTWAVVGRLLGLEDRYNLALRCTPELVDKLFVQVGLACLKSMDHRSVSLQMECFKGLSNSCPIPLLFTLKGWFYVCMKNTIPGYEGKNLIKLMNFSDRVCIKMLQTFIFLLSASAITRHIVNSMLGLWIGYGMVKRKFPLYLPKLW